MGRLPYEKQYELAYQIYEALCANNSAYERRQRGYFNRGRLGPQHQSTLAASGAVLDTQCQGDDDVRHPRF